MSRATISGLVTSPVFVELCQKVPGTDLVSPWVRSVTTTLLHTTVIGGLQFGWNVAVKVREKFALPFCTGN